MTGDNFRAEVDRIIEDLAPASLYGKRLALEEHNWGGRHATWSSDDMCSWQMAMAERGLTAPTWQVQHGGAGWSAEEAATLQRALRERQLPPPLVGIGLTMVGPVIQRYGTEEQKKRFLPATARGEIRWCQGFSEPEAGSDLPNLRTRAVGDGDEYIVNGQKVWTSHAHKSDWIIALVRTDPDLPKRDGITCLLIDMASAGVQARPIQLISGASPFCETFFDDVHVPVANVLGEENAGWAVARYVLAHERDMLGGITVGGQKSETLGELARHYLREVDGRLADAGLRRTIALSEIDAAAYSLLASGKVSRPAGPNLLKLVSSELNQERLTLRQSIVGLPAAVWSGTGASDDELKLSRTWLRSRAYSIEGGTSEVMLNAIARQTLGLPSQRQTP